MLVVDKKTFMFDTREIHSSDYPYDVDGYDVLTFQYCKNKVDVDGFTLVKEHFTSIIDLTKDLDTIWRNIYKNTRRLINKAGRDGIKIRINENYDEFYQVFDSFMKKKKFAPLFGIFKAFGVGGLSLETMKKYGTLFVAVYNDEVLAGSFHLENLSSINAWVGASKRLDADKEKAKLIGEANRLIHWEAIKYAKEKGIKEYDFGGIFSDEEVKKDRMKRGIRSFKLKFGGKTVVRYQYQKIYSKTYKLLYCLYNLKGFVRSKKC